MGASTSREEPLLQSVEVEDPTTNNPSGGNAGNERGETSRDDQSIPEPITSKVWTISRVPEREREVDEKA